MFHTFPPRKASVMSHSTASSFSVTFNISLSKPNYFFFNLLPWTHFILSHFIHRWCTKPTAKNCSCKKESWENDFVTDNQRSKLNKSNGWEFLRNGSWSQLSGSEKLVLLFFLPYLLMQSISTILIHLFSLIFLLHQTGE